MKPKVDLATALLDFKLAHEADHDTAFDELLILLLDPVSCEMRLILLDELQQGREPTPRSLATQQRWKEIVNIVSSEGPVPALEAGKVTIDELDAITWNSAALREVQQRLLAPPVVAPTAPPVKDLTWLLHHDRDRFRERLAGTMPTLIDFLGWTECDDHDLLRFLEERGSKLDPRESFRGAASRWLVEYAQRQKWPARVLTVDDWRLVIYTASLAAVRDVYGKRSGNPPWVAEYFEQIGRPVAIAPRALLEALPVSIAAKIPIGLPGFRRDVYNSVRRQYEQACVDWQLL